MANQNKPVGVSVVEDSSAVGAKTCRDRTKTANAETRLEGSNFWWRIPLDSKFRS